MGANLMRRCCCRCQPCCAPACLKLTLDNWYTGIHTAVAGTPNTCRWLYTLNNACASDAPLKFVIPITTDPAQCFENEYFLHCMAPYVPPPDPWCPGLLAAIDATCDTESPLGPRYPLLFGAGQAGVIKITGSITCDRDGSNPKLTLLARAIIYEVGAVTVGPVLLDVRDYPLSGTCDDTVVFESDTGSPYVFTGASTNNYTDPFAQGGTATIELGACDETGAFCTGLPSDDTYRQAKRCSDDAVSNIWTDTLTAANWGGAFKYSDDECYYWDTLVVDELPPDPIIFVPGDATPFEDCGDCQGCTEPCVECDDCPLYCADEGKTYLSLRLEIPGGECGSCATYGGPTGDDGCRRCLSCIPVVDPDTGTVDTDCGTYNVNSDAECLAHDPPGYVICQPGCEGDGSISPCSFITYVADLDIPLVSQTSTTMTFHDVVPLGLAGDLDITVVFDCVAESYAFTIVIDGYNGATDRCRMEETQSGAGVTCAGITFGFDIPMTDETLETTCTGNGVLVSNVAIHREGCE